MHRFLTNCSPASTWFLLLVRKPQSWELLQCARADASPEAVLHQCLGSSVSHPHPHPPPQPSWEGIELNGLKFMKWSIALFLLLLKLGDQVMWLCLPGWGCSGHTASPWAGELHHSLPSGLSLASLCWQFVTGKTFDVLIIEADPQIAASLRVPGAAHRDAQRLARQQRAAGP